MDHAPGRRAVNTVLTGIFNEIRNNQKKGAGLLIIDNRQITVQAVLVDGWNAFRMMGLDLRSFGGQAGLYFFRQQT